MDVVRAQGLQQDLVQRRVSLLQDLAEAQALQRKEAPQTDIIEEKWHIRLSPVTPTSLTGQRNQGTV